MNHGSSGGRRTLAFSPSVATPKPGSAPVPSVADARAAFGSGVGSLRSHELAEVLTSLHLDVSGGSALARVTERRAEALRVARTPHAAHRACFSLARFPMRRRSACSRSRCCRAAPGRSPASEEGSCFLVALAHSSLSAQRRYVAHARVTQSNLMSR